MSDYNRNGCLTLVPMPGFEGMAQQMKDYIEGRDRRTLVYIATPHFGFRANGEPFIRLGKKHIGGHDCIVVGSGPGTPLVLLQLFFLLGYLVGHRATRIALLLGYLPLCRSDKDEGALEFGIAKHAIHLMESSAYGKLDRIISSDLHAPQVVLAASRLGIITEVSLARHIFADVVAAARQVNDNICILFPDDGAAKRYEGIKDALSTETGIQYPTVYCKKRRHSSKSSQMVGLYGDTEKLPGSLVIGLDDELATGGTNLTTAASMKSDYGASAYWATVIHGVLCGSATSTLMQGGCPIDRVVVTDTIPVHLRPELTPLVESGRLHVVSWIQDAAQLVFHHHWDEDIRETR